MKLPELVVLQNIPSAEARMVRMVCLTRDIPTVNCSMEGLGSYVDELRSGRSLAIGSVEFLRQAMKVCAIAEPDNISYPEGAQKFLGRSIKKRNAGEVLGQHFVKPVQTKLFTGFVFDTMRKEESYSESDRESLDAFLKMPANEKVWVSECVDFVSEWRYYVRGGAIIGSARYDPDGPDNALAPDLQVVAQCIESCGLDHPFAVDMGVTQAGDTVLVEFNDAWALGLYGKAMEPSAYLEFLHERWESLVDSDLQNNQKSKFVR